MIKVGIIGCGKVADKHVNQILRIPDCEIVGVCDQEEMMAGQLSERFAIKRQFNHHQKMLEVCRPDVVHITTPPQSHYSLSRECLEAGCHVYVEKPFTMNYEEAKDLISIAEKQGLKLTVGHETQFMPVANEMRRLIHSGYLGGAPIHMESIYCYELSDERYAKAFLGDKNHWVRQLPGGGLLHNIISHGIGKIVEYLQDEKVTLLASGFTSMFLEGIGETGIIDECRVIISDSHKTTAYFTFSSQISPAQHQFKVCGPVNSLVADHEHQTLTKVPGKTYKSYLNQFIPPFKDAKQQFLNGCSNIGKFIRNEFHADSAIHLLISSFYRSLIENTPPPVPYRDILLTSQIIDEIFNQMGCSADQ